MKHYNGSPAAEVYGNYHTGGEQGPIVAFSLKRPNGEFVGYAEVDKLANINGFQIRVRMPCSRTIVSATTLIMPLS
jgi:molybdenum cofactor sulfurtransferase